MLSDVIIVNINGLLMNERIWIYNKKSQKKIHVDCGIFNLYWSKHFENNLKVFIDFHQLCQI